MRRLAQGAPSSEIGCESGHPTVIVNSWPSPLGEGYEFNFYPVWLKKQVAAPPRCR